MILGKQPSSRANTGCQGWLSHSFGTRIFFLTFLTCSPSPSPSQQYELWKKISAEKYKRREVIEACLVWWKILLTPGHKRCWRQILLIVFCSFCSKLSLLNFSLSTAMGVDFVRLLDLGPDFPQILRNSILDNLDNNFCKILSAFKVNLPGK